MCIGLILSVGLLSGLLVMEGPEDWEHSEEVLIPSGA